MTALLILALIGAALSKAVIAGAGQLDQGFGSGGIVTTDFLGGIDQAFAIAIQADDKVVAARTIGRAVQRLEAASPSVDVAGVTTLLVLTAKAVAVDAIARAQLLAIRPNIVTGVADANTLVAEGDALRAIGKNTGAVDKYGEAVRRVQHFL